MADEENLAERVAKCLCPGGELINLTEAEVRALHRCRAEFAVALRKLYKTMDARKADDLVRKVLKRVVE